MKMRSLRRPGAILLLGFLLTGCRSYNDLGQREPMMEAMLNAIEASEQELTQARQELQALHLAVVPDDSLEGIARDFQIVVDAHEAMLEHHEEMAAELMDGEWYRPLNRAYGTVLVEQEILRHRYAVLLAAATATADTTENPPRQLGLSTESSYYMAPPYYQRLMAASPLSEGESPVGAQPDSVEGPQARPDTLTAAPPLPDSTQE